MQDSETLAFRDRVLRGGLADQGEADSAAAQAVEDSAGAVVEVEDGGAECVGADRAAGLRVSSP